MTGVGDVLVLAGLLAAALLVLLWEPKPKPRRFRHLTRGGRR